MLGFSTWVTIYKDLAFIYAWQIVLCSFKMLMSVSLLFLYVLMTSLLQAFIVRHFPLYWLSSIVYSQWKTSGSLHFLPIEVMAIYLSESKYIYDLLHWTKMDGATPTSSSVSSGSKLSKYECELLPNWIEYRIVVGALKCVALTCLDISFAVNQVYQFIHSPNTSH